MTASTTRSPALWGEKLSEELPSSVAKLPTAEIEVDPSPAQLSPTVPPQAL